MKTSKGKFDFEGFINKVVDRSKEIPSVVKKINSEVKKTTIYNDFKKIDLKKVKSFLLKKW